MNSKIAKISLMILLAALLSLLYITPTKPSPHALQHAASDFAQTCINLHTSFTTELGQTNQTVKNFISAAIIVMAIFAGVKASPRIRSRRVKRLSEQICFSFSKFISWLSLLEKRSDLSAA